MPVLLCCPPVLLPAATGRCPGGMESPWPMSEGTGQADLAPAHPGRQGQPRPDKINQLPANCILVSKKKFVDITH